MTILYLYMHITKKTMFKPAFLGAGAVGNLQLKVYRLYHQFDKGN